MTQYLPFIRFEPRTIFNFRRCSFNCLEIAFAFLLLFSGKARAAADIANEDEEKLKICFESWAFYCLSDLSFFFFLMKLMNCSCGRGKASLPLRLYSKYVISSVVRTLWRTWWLCTDATYLWNMSIGIQTDISQSWFNFFAGCQFVDPDFRGRRAQNHCAFLFTPAARE